LIESYSFGKVIVDGKTYTQDIIIYPSGRIEGSWWRKGGHSVCLEDIKEIFNEKPEVLVIGKGNPGMMSVLPPVKKALLEYGITLIEEPTENAVKTHNELYLKKRVCTALHLTC